VTTRGLQELPALLGRQAVPGLVRQKCDRGRTESSAHEVEEQREKGQRHRHILAHGVPTGTGERGVIR
jgi:hypothetical protein